MAKSILPFLPLLLSHLYIASTAESVVPASFIKSSCNGTRYPVLCVRTLLPYARTIGYSRHELAQTALSVSLAKAKSANGVMTKLAKLKGLKATERLAVEDCVDQMDDGVDRLSRSARELRQTGKAGSKNFALRVSNVQTWVSAALTNGITCLDGFEDKALKGKVQASVSQTVTDAVQVTSNALALINKFSET